MTKCKISSLYYALDFVAMKLILKSGGFIHDLFQGDLIFDCSAFHRSCFTKFFSIWSL